MTIPHAEGPPPEPRRAWQRFVGADADQVVTDVPPPVADHPPVESVDLSRRVARAMNRANAAHKGLSLTDKNKLAALCVPGATFEGLPQEWQDWIRSAERMRPVRA